jgi:hypothetical protein
MKTLIYKLTNQNLQTHNGYQWIIGKWRETDGSGELCGPGWLHGYKDPLLAAFFNPIHANIIEPLLWEAEADGKYLNDHGRKCGYTKMRIIQQIPLPKITTEQLIEIGIRCAMEIYTEKPWIEWAKNWLNGKDRSAHAADAAAYVAAHAADAAAYAAANAAAATANAALDAANDAAHAATVVAHTVAYAADVNIDVLKIIREVVNK